MAILRNGDAFQNCAMITEWRHSRDLNLMFLQLVDCTILQHICHSAFMTPKSQHLRIDTIKIVPWNNNSFVSFFYSSLVFKILILILLPIAIYRLQIWSEFDTISILVVFFPMYAPRRCHGKQSISLFSIANIKVHSNSYIKKSIWDIPMALTKLWQSKIRRNYLW